MKLIPGELYDIMDGGCGMHSFRGKYLYRVHNNYRDKYCYLFKITSGYSAEYCLCNFSLSEDKDGGTIYLVANYYGKDLTSFRWCRDGGKTQKDDVWIETKW